MLTYCTNIHPGESWAEAFASVRAHVPRVHQGLGGQEPFAVCLWLSGRAAVELDDRAAQELADWCHANNTFVSSINGFPYGGFHNVRVKEHAYLPDWRDPERLAHSARLADLLGLWLEGQECGVVSTVPIGFRHANADWTEAKRNLVQALAHFDRVAQRTGKNLILALEPEPGCVLETTADVVRFFGELRLGADLRRHLGICYDCCHQAVMFEHPADSLQALAEAGIGIAQLHVSAALQVRGPDLASLQRFAEPCYLHQTVGRTAEGKLLRFTDLDDAIAAEVDGRQVQEWRVHFHVPVFAPCLDGCCTTQSHLQEMLARVAPDIPLVVETYSFGVLPLALRTNSVVDSVVRELRWVREQLARRAGSVRA